MLGGCLHSKEKSSSPSNTDNSNAQFSPKVLQNNFFLIFNDFLQMSVKFSFFLCFASVLFSSSCNPSLYSISFHLSHLSCPIPSHLSHLIPFHLIPSHLILSISSHLISFHPNLILYVSSPYSYCSYPVLTWEGKAHC